MEVERRTVGGKRREGCGEKKWERGKWGRGRGEKS